MCIGGDFSLVNRMANSVHYFIIHVIISGVGIH